MRQYPHRPDAAHLTKNARFPYGRVDKLLARIDRSGPEIWETMGLIAVQTGWQAMALAWAEERPLADVRRYLDLTADWSRQLMTAHPTSLDVLHVPGWLWTFVIAGDRESALRLAARIPAQLSVAIAGNAPIADETAAVARLVDGSDPRPAVQALQATLSDPQVDAELAERLGPVLKTVGAIAAADPAATARGFVTMNEHHIARCGSSTAARRSIDGLIDMTALMLAALAAGRGLPTPVDNPTCRPRCSESARPARRAKTRALFALWRQPLSPSASTGEESSASRSSLRPVRSAQATTSS